MQQPERLAQIKEIRPLYPIVPVRHNTDKDPDSRRQPPRRPPRGEDAPPKRDPQDGTIDEYAK